MSEWAVKRFWAEATAAPCDGGFAVTLDGRAVKTPARAPLVVPTLALAQAIAAEWQAQTGRVAPETMPCTRAANSAIDKVTPQFAEVADMIAAYGGTDLLCYRAEGPAGLVARQAAWDGLLDWSGDLLAAPLRVTVGVIPVPQPAGSLARLQAQVHAASPFELTALYDLVAISGSLILGLAVCAGRLDAAAAWDLSRIDEVWQAEVWGRDEDAAAQEDHRRKGLLQAERFYRLCH